MLGQVKHEPSEVPDQVLVFDSTTGQASMQKVRFPQPHEVVWIRLLDPKPEEVRHVLEDLFHCHPLMVEDCIKLNQRPKLDRYKENFFLSFFAVANKELKAKEIALVMGQNYVITIYKEEIPYLEEVYRDLQQVEGRMTHASDVLYEILDRCVDEYSVLVNHVEDRVDRLERAIQRNPNVRIAKELFSLKRSLHAVRRIFVEEKTIIGVIGHQNFSYTREESEVYFVDIYDHISRVIDSIDIFRESLTGLLELQMAMKSDRMNEIMKTLTIISSIFLPLTFIVGLYGMNFKYIPELSWHYGYFYVLGLMAAVAIGLWIFYKRKKWL